MRERKSSGGAGHGDFERAARDAEIPDARAEKSSRGVCPGNDGVEPDAHVAAQSPLKIPRAEEIQTAPGYNFTGMQMDHGNHQKLAKATKLPHRLVYPCALQIFLRLRHTQFARPLFSYSLAPICEGYKPLFPQLLSFHIHTKPPGVWGSGRLLRSSRHSGVWKGGEVREAFSFAPQVIAAQFAQRVGNEFSGDFFAPGHVEIGVFERLGNSRGECGGLATCVVSQRTPHPKLRPFPPRHRP